MSSGRSPRVGGRDHTPNCDASAPGVGRRHGDRVLAGAGAGKRTLVPELPSGALQGPLVQLGAEPYPAGLAGDDLGGGGRQQLCYPGSLDGLCPLGAPHHLHHPAAAGCRPLRPGSRALAWRWYCGSCSRLPFLPLRPDPSAWWKSRRLCTLASWPAWPLPPDLDKVELTATYLDPVALSGGAREPRLNRDVTH